MSEQVKTATERAESIFTATEDSLNKDWDRKENLQFPNLLNMVLKRLNLTGDAVAEVDPFMRSFVRNHPDYFVSRGAKGGIMLRSVYEQRLAKKAEVEAAKAVLKMQVDAKVATTTATVTTDGADNV